MESVAHIVCGNISPDQRMCDEFKVDAISMAFDVISYDPNIVTFPTMNAISNLLFFFTECGDLIIDDGAVGAILKINSKKIIIEFVKFFF